MAEPFIIITPDPPIATLVARLEAAPKRLQRVLRLTRNATLKTGRTRIARALKAEINLPYATIRDLVKATPSPDGVSGRIDVSRKEVPLIDFLGTRATRSGVSVLVRRDKGREVLTGTFIATMPSGHTGVYERGTHLPTSGPNVGKGKLIAGRRFRSVGRFVIIERFGLTLTGYLSNAPAIAKQISGDLAMVATKNFISKARYVFGDDAVLNNGPVESE